MVQIFLFFRLMWEFINSLGERGDFFQHYCIKIIDFWSTETASVRKASEKKNPPTCVVYSSSVTIH